jgi:DNA-binding transcriptional ArsR family regulator
VPPLSGMTIEMLDAIATQFRALSEPSRLHLLQVLMTGDRTVTELSETSGLSQANTSKHLSVLAAAGFVNRRREGTRAVYTITDPATRTLCDLMCGRLVERRASQLRLLVGGADGGDAS